MSIPFKISKFFLYASVFAIAIVSSATIFPFIVAKYSWFRLSVDFALIFFLIGLLRHPSEETSRYIQNFKKLILSPIGIAVSAFALMFLLAGVFGVNPANSFWSNFERGEGGFQILHLYIFFLLLGTMFTEEKQWRTIFTCSIATALITLGYGVLAGFGVSEIIGPAFTPGYRIQGTIGNPAYVAVYLIFIMFYALYMIFTKYRHKLLSPLAIGLLAALIASIVGFLAAATRGAVIGLFGGGFVFLVYLIFAGKKFRRTFIALAAGLVLLFGLGVVFKDSVVIQKLPFARIFDISVTAQTFHDRTVIWKMAWDGFKARPIFGYGPENFLNVFDAQFNTEYYVSGQQMGSWFDRAHSVIFDYLSETGILGFLSYVSMFGVFYFLIFKRFKKKEHVINGEHSHNTIDEQASRFSLLPIAAKALVFVLPIAYLIQGLVLFDILPTYINLFLFFAFAYYLFSPAHIASHLASSQHKNENDGIKYAVISTLGIVLTVLMIVYGSVLPYLRAKAYVDAMQGVANVRTIVDFETLFNKAYNIPSPVGDEELTKFLLGSIVGLVSGQPDQPEEVTRALADYIIPKIDQNDTRHLLPAASLYGILWQRFHKEEDYQKALGYYLKAKEMGPKLPPVLYSLLSMYQVHGDTDKAKDIAKTILQYWPNDTTASQLIINNK